jgi:hypothetical protein
MSMHSRLMIVLLAAGAYLLQSFAWPLFAGRDCASYLLYYLELNEAQPLYQTLMLYRTPAAPIFHGLLLDLSRRWLGSALLDELAMGALYCFSILIIYQLGNRWSSSAGWLAALFLLLQPGYAVLFHSVSSDGLYAAAWLAWVWLIFRTMDSPRLGYFALHGVCLWGLVMIRPSSQFLLPFIFFPWLLRLPIWGRLQRFVLLLGALGLCLVSWSTYNLLRYDDFTVTRGTGTLPLTRIFTTGVPPLRADNGPASAALIASIQSDLLTRQPYLAYGIDLSAFLSSGSTRMLGDIFSLADRTWGWDDDQHHLLQVALETVRSDPFAYLWSVSRSAGGAFIQNLVQPAPTLPQPAPESVVPRDTRGLPIPNEGQPIPAGNLFWLASSPDQRVQYAWDTFFETGKLQIANPELRRRDLALQDRLAGLLALLPSRAGSPSVAGLLNSLARHYPPMVIWLLLAMLGLPLKPLRCEDQVLAGVLLLALLVVLGSYAGIHKILHYRVPFDSLFIFAGMIGGSKLLRRCVPGASGRASS